MSAPKKQSPGPGRKKPSFSQPSSRWETPLDMTAPEMDHIRRWVESSDRGPLDLDQTTADLRRTYRALN